MSGHSKWATIKHAKGIKDVKRGKLFTQLSRELTFASKMSGVSDPSESPMLRVAVDKAKASNMPKDTIERAINKGLGITDDDVALFENTYEAYSIGNVPLLIDTETDNPNRTITEVRNIVNKAGGKMVSAGSLTFQFDEIGKVICVVGEVDDIEAILLELMEVDGVIDFKRDGEQIIVLTQKEKFSSVVDSLSTMGGVDIDSAKIIKKIQEQYKAPVNVRMSELTDQLEDLLDVVNIWRGDE